IDAHVVPHPPPQQFVDRHSKGLALDVPERLLDAGDSAEADGAERPEAEAGHPPYDVLDAGRVLADHEGLQVLDGRADGARLPFERRLAPAMQAGLVGQDLDEDPVAMDRVDDDRTN